MRPLTIRDQYTNCATRLNIPNRTTEFEVILSVISLSPTKKMHVGVTSSNFGIVANAEQHGGREGPPVVAWPAFGSG